MLCLAIMTNTPTMKGNQSKAIVLYKDNINVMAHKSLIDPTHTGMLKILEVL
jgi:hypothetical protein